MHVYGSLASPFVQRVLIAAHLKGHEIELRPPPGGSMRSPEYLAISPMARIPLLALDDGRHICESAAIAGYLDEALPGPALLPDDPVERARVREIESIALAELAAGIRPLMAQLVFRAMGSPDVVTAARATANAGLTALDRLVGTGGFAVGDRPTLADAVLVPVLTLIRIVDPMTGLLAELARRPALAGYADRALDHPVLARAADEMTEAFATILARSAQAS